MVPYVVRFKNILTTARMLTENKVGSINEVMDQKYSVIVKILRSPHHKPLDN